MIEGVITKGIGGFYYVATDNGIAECRARGKLRKEKITPTVGDKVEITIVNQNPLQGALENIQERTNFLIRPPVANVDTVVAVISTTSPNPDYYMIDKLIVTAEKFGIEVIVAVNKTDIGSPDKTFEIYNNAGYKAIKVCAKENEGTDVLKELIKGKITAFAGNSGVGKSSLLNSLGFNLETGIVSKIERGKHTTRHVELMPLDNGGFVIDTPGFSILEINDIKYDELKNYFIEFEKYDNCRFANCLHVGVNVNDCAVCAAVENGEIFESRYNSYKALYNILKNIKEWD